MCLNAASSNRVAFTRYRAHRRCGSRQCIQSSIESDRSPGGACRRRRLPGNSEAGEATPLSCFRFVALLREAGLAGCWCQALVTQDRATTARLVSDPRVGYFSFVGSAAVGWRLRSLLAPGTRCALEHGGVAPVIVAGDADLEWALPRITKGAFYHAGQVCVSVQRVFAHRSIVRRVRRWPGGACQPPPGGRSYRCPTPKSGR